MREFKLLEESRDRLLEVAHMYKGQVGNLEERVGDLANDAANKGEYLARHQARVEQLSSVVAFQQHQARSMPGTTHTRGVSVYSVAHSGSRTPGVAAPITQASSVAPTDYSLSGLG